MNNRLILVFWSILTVLVPADTIFGQELTDSLSGSVSYVTSRNVYVKFSSTMNLAAGDTLFTSEGGFLAPSLLIESVSSVSCLCKPLAGKTFKVGDNIISRKRKTVSPVMEKTVNPLPVAESAFRQDTVAKKAVPDEKKAYPVHGNISAAGYLNFSDQSENSQRFRYTVALKTGDRSSRLTAETYFTFSHKIGEWNQISDDVFNGLKIYNLSVSYQFNPHHQVWFGRRINPRISNIGAVDGLQYEFRLKNFSLGVVAGSRPDYRNYAFNAGLFQYGGYLGHDFAGKRGNMQTTLAFIQQNNQGNTDRRFLYLQHANALVKNLMFFGTAEFDLYNQSWNSEDSSLQKDQSPKLSNLYLSLRYRPVRFLSLSVSYSERQNVIYYETYKDIIQTLLEAATVKGWVGNIGIYPGKNLSIGIQGSYRDSKNDVRPTKSLHGYCTFAKIPGIDAALSLTTTLLETGYMDGMIIGAGISRLFLSGKLSTGLGYKYVNYDYIQWDSKTTQHIPEVNLNWRLLKKLSCSLYLEGTFEKSSIFNRVYINITQRF